MYNREEWVLAVLCGAPVRRWHGVECPKCGTRKTMYARSIAGFIVDRCVACGHVWETKK